MSRNLHALLGVVTLGLVLVGPQVAMGQADEGTATSSSAEEAPGAAPVEDAPPAPDPELLVPPAEAASGSEASDQGQGSAQPESSESPSPASQGAGDPEGVSGTAPAAETGGAGTAEEPPREDTATSGQQPSDAEPSLQEEGRKEKMDKKKIQADEMLKKFDKQKRAFIKCANDIPLDIAPEFYLLMLDGCQWRASMASGTAEK